MKYHIEISAKENDKLTLWYQADIEAYTLPEATIKLGAQIIEGVEQAVREQKGRLNNEQ